ncbi:LysR family transcriptional regulator [Erwinia sp. JUb26]|uniref:LysR family transcriptional regulator n=1 Tax=Erwinia sp. JUb26 TaxID=2485126 RepID=UPI000F4624D3
MLNFRRVAGGCYVIKSGFIAFFITTARSNSFKETAEKWGQLRREVSRSNKELESVLGEILFYRNTRSIIVTAFCRDILPECEAVIEKVNDIFTTCGKIHRNIKSIV